MSSPDQLISSLPERIPFCKLSASANDFIVLDNRAGAFSAASGELARRLCMRRYSIGADGLILIENSNKASVRMRFFNPDGNEFNTCGNGGRCAARFAFFSVITGRRMTLETNIGVVDAEVNNNVVKLKFISPAEVRLNVPVVMSGKTIRGHFVRLGEPHFVVYAGDLRNQQILPVARRIRYHEAFGSEGTNVHFIEPVSRNRIKIRHYERGVEDETLACGSGCVSAAVATFLAKQSDPPVVFEPQSGIPVRVHFNPENRFSDLYLEGDARLVYRGELTKEALLGFPIVRQS